MQSAIQQSMPAQIPPALKKGDTIAIVSPSSRTHDSQPWRIERATAFLEKHGYHVKVIRTPNLPPEPLAENIATRVEEIHAAFRDRHVKAIVCAIGGSGAVKLLPHLDPEVIRSNPKIFTGMSDITPLHHFCYQAGNLRTFYGPNAINQLGEWPGPMLLTWDHFVTVTTRPDEPVGLVPRSDGYTDEIPDRATEPERIREGRMEGRKMKAARRWKWIKRGDQSNDGSVEGELWGGCLPSLVRFPGTEWEVSYEGKVMFFEIPKAYSIDLVIDNLNTFKSKGIWDQIVGLIVGRPHSFTSTEQISAEDEKDFENAIADALKAFDFPVLAGVDIGHTDPMLTVPLGAKVRLDPGRDAWEVLEAGVC